jgi:hypothetical protein
MNNRVILRSIALICLIVSVNCKDRGLDTGNLQFENVVWQLHYFETVGGPIDTIADSRTYSILFVSDTVAQVRADCNDCAATYHAFPIGTDRAISMRDFLCTKVYCGSQSLDGRFLNALGAATSFSIQKNVLRVFYNGQKQVLNFRPSS